MGGPSKEEALAFCLMLQSGMPPGEAILYFLTEGASWEPTEVDRLCRSWLRSAAVKGARDAVMGRPWQDMTLEERLKFAVDKHYSEMAYFLYSRNYVELTGADKMKADTCRTALEAKLAGMAGKLDPLSRFWEDLRSGRVALGGSQLAAIPVGRAG